ncbi:ABC transporter ATP-binding protein [Dictyobacter formicarum]|uniref:ABC transporter ATP-binding protein n=1 Tax=Dictyobacter formicarum TaxID=2778368 RepID=A0ABQ3VJX2_9CHLR|nr:ABC transporter ATP-binding protein [Dictyobacter formicarum]GHO86517.1 ABC transporter ATP-binding protein [Dictyobacter formicarum]
MLDAAFETQVDAFHLDVAFSIQSGQTTVLLGESGAGKSTILRLLAGLQLPQQGHMVLNGITYYNSKAGIFIPPQRRPFGYVFQDYVLFPHLTVFENVAFGLRAQHLPRSRVRASVAEALEMVQLPHLSQRLPAQLSGGQQQRVAIARALALRPQLLLLDEPLAALDVQTRREVRQELRTILREVQITTLFVTHHYLDGLLFGDQLLVVDQGRLVQQGDQRELREFPRSSYIAELVGVNFFRGQLLRTENETTCLIRLLPNPSTNQPVEMVAMLKEQATLPVSGTEIFVVIDPRSITLHLAQPEGSARNVFQGTIMHIIPLSTSTGSYDGKVRVSIALSQAGAPLTAEVTENSVTRMELQEGQTIFATFKASEANAYL